MNHVKTSLCCCSNCKNVTICSHYNTLFSLHIKLNINIDNCEYMIPTNSLVQEKTYTVRADILDNSRIIKELERKQKQHTVDNTKDKTTEKRCGVCGAKVSSLSVCSTCGKSFCSNCGGILSGKYECSICEPLFDDSEYIGMVIEEDKDSIL